MLASLASWSVSCDRSKRKDFERLLRLMLLLVDSLGHHPRRPRHSQVTPDKETCRNVAFVAAIVRNNEHALSAIHALGFLAGIAGATGHNYGNEAASPPFREQSDLITTG